MGLLVSIRKILKKRDMLKHNHILISPEHIKNVKLKIEGEANEISIDTKKLSSKSKIRISIYGDHNKVIIKEGFCLSGHVDITIGQKHPNFGKVVEHELVVDENTSAESFSYVAHNSHAFCHIGKNCMFAYGIMLYNTDAHPVFDINTKQIINRVKGIEIGNHVWVGAYATILKNTTIGDDCIVGMRSVVSGKFLEQHTALAGNPARVVKKGITWDSNGAACGYIDNVFEK